MNRRILWLLVILCPFLLALAACPPYNEDPPGTNYNVKVTWGDYCSQDRVSLDVYELLVNGVSYGENSPRTASTIYGLVEGQNQLAIRFIPKEYSQWCGGYFIALEGGALFEDGSVFVTGLMNLAEETEHSYLVNVSPADLAQ